MQVQIKLYVLLLLRVGRRDFVSEYVLALLKCKGIGNVKVLNYILKNQKDINKIKNNLSELISFDDLENFE